MQIVIDISESDYDDVIHNRDLNISNTNIWKAIRNGRILPKGGRKFEEIVVQYPPAELCTYPEYRGKPYFSIKYEENGEYFVGYGTYNPKVFSGFLRQFLFAQTITEQRGGKRIMKCPYRKITLHRTYEEGGYTADEEAFADCYENECPFYTTLEFKSVKVKVEQCRIAEKMVNNADKGDKKEK